VVEHSDILASIGRIQDPDDDTVERENQPQQVAV